MSPWFSYVIAFLVFCHGFVYLRVGSQLPAPVPRWTGHSWLLGSALTRGGLTTAVVGLHVAAGVATLACAIAIAIAPYAPGWWRPFAIAGGATGIVAFFVFWDGQTKFLFEEGVLGAVVSTILLVGAIAFPAAFR